MSYKANETVYGGTKLGNCPICNSMSIKNIFKIPYHLLEEDIPYRNCHQRYVVTYDYEMIYCWDVCNDCGTLFMNPIEPYIHNSIRDEAIKQVKSGYQMNSYRYRMNEILPHIKQFGTLLEVGCAGGQVLNLLRNHADTLKSPWDRIIGVEVNQTTVDYLNSQGFESYNRPFEEGLPEVPDDTVDCVLMHEVIEHLDSPYKCFCIIAKLLRKGGVFATSVEMQGGKLFLRPAENVCTNLDALTTVFGKLGMKIIYSKEHSGKLRVIGEKL